MNGFGKVLIRFAIEKLSTAKVFIQIISAGASASRKFSLIIPIAKENCAEMMFCGLFDQDGEQCLVTS